MGTQAPPMESALTGSGLSVLCLLATSDMADLLEESDMEDLLEELDMEDLLEELDMEDLLEQQHLWPVLMDSPTVESTGAKTADTTFVSYFKEHNNLQTHTNKTYKRQNSYNAGVLKSYL